MKIKRTMMKRLFCLIGVIVLSTTYVNPVMAKTNKDTNTSSQKMEDPCKEILSLVNEKRKEADLDPLVWNDVLANDASLRAKEISKKFSHTRPNGKDWYTLDEDNMYGENLGKGYETAQEVFDAWMNSKSHKENILWEEFTQIGIAVYVTKSGSCYWVQEFGY